jgi:cell division protein ZapA (FtsZ GTPase activity inhibitor)
MAKPQSYENHARFDPLVHFSTMPVLLVNLGLSIYYTLHNWPIHNKLALWWIVMSLTLIVMNVAARTAALRAQNRVIRLEEKLRIASLVTASELVELDSLTMEQYIALRFASNPELPELARRAVREKLTGKQIKESVVSWRADNDRV